MALPAGNYNLDNQSSATSAATGGRIDNGMIFNSSGAGNIGIVKLLTYTGIGYLLWQIFRRK